ncbi:MAG: S-adenosyl-L-methionine-dependent methyltransferase [Monoraphidium minutum]|nr:MAG: S-adenosyl-L-methionine-dependent methyltransferase [Monoraphidium minutum]
MAVPAGDADGGPAPCRGGGGGGGGLGSGCDCRPQSSSCAPAAPAAPAPPPPPPPPAPASAALPPLPPALSAGAGPPPVPRVVYAQGSYWDGRYAAARPHQPAHFDWFFSFAALRPLLAHAVTLPGEPALHVGCGNSDLGVGLGADGTPVVNTDISPVVIAQMRNAAAAAAAATAAAAAAAAAAVADCRSMPQYADGRFGSVIDKGTLDAVLCSGTGLGDARNYVSEAHRLLAPGGVFLLISLGQPDARLGVRWQRVSVYFLPKPRLYRANEQSLFGARPPPPPAVPPPAGAPPAPPARHGGKDEPVDWLGPYEVGPELEAALAAPGLDPSEYFFAYACVKPPPATPRSRRASALSAGGGPPPERLGSGGGDSGGVLALLERAASSGGGGGGGAAAAAARGASGEPPQVLVIP